MNTIKHTLSLLVCALSTSISVAGPASLTVKFDNPIFNGSGYDAVSVTFPNQSPSTNSTTVNNVAAGRFQGTGSNFTGIDPMVVVDGPDNLYLYCYDVYEHIGSGWVVNYNVNFTGAQARTLDFLGAVNAVMNGSKGVNDLGYDRFAWLHPVNEFQSAAIQLGIWESKYESALNSWNILDGGFRAGSLETQTNGYLSGFFTQISASDALDNRFVITLEANNAQDMITGDPPANVPEPGTLALLGAALAGLALNQRKKAQQA